MYYTWYYYNVINLFFGLQYLHTLIITFTLDGSSKLKVSAEWSLTHRNDLMKSKGKHTVTIYQEDISQLSACIDMFEKSSSYKCKQFVIENLIPKFIVLNLKSSKVQSDLMLHNPCKFYIHY